LLGALIVTEGKGGQVGAAAASRLSFTVEPASTLEAVWLMLLAGRLLRRRYRLTIARR
jgi:hypothetical protein